MNKNSGVALKNIPFPFYIIRERAFSSKSNFKKI